MERKKRIILVITIVVLFFGGIAIGAGAVYLMIRPESEIGRADGLTEEQYQLLVDSMLRGEFEQMSDINRRNAWLMLDLMREVEFVENRYPGESGVSLATWILELLNIGEIQELEFVRIEELHYGDLAADLLMRLLSEESNIYYIWYNRTWGLQLVIAEDEYGEIIYSSGWHSIRDGQICDRWTGECRCFTDACR